MYATVCKRAWGEKMTLHSLGLQIYSRVPACLFALFLSATTKRFSGYRGVVAMGSPRCTAYWFSNSGKENAFSPIALKERSQRRF